jgi:phthiocerol/phenolphthiocerol synthesis type-I polyketide synthase E
MGEPEVDYGGAIAIIGMSCRVPGAASLQAFWNNLRGGSQSISFFAQSEVDTSVVDPSELADPHYVRARGLLEDIEGFDARLFGFTPREAELTDPQHRVFLECAWEALESGGYDPWRYRGSVGVFGGAGANTYLMFHLLPAGRLSGSVAALQGFIHNKNDHLTTRTAYKLNLRGPAVSVQTACSTSLVAVSLAVQSLLNFQVDLALAGASSITVPQHTGYLYHERGIGSPDGHCRPFDADAKGTVGGNGAGVVLLKRLEEAIADGDTIHAVLRGIAVNNDGASRAGYTAPGDGQAEVVALAQALAGVSPDSITYVEAHGTGTPIGDPIEVAALTQAFRRGTDRRSFCALGSVKANLGHLDTAAGMAGLIKTVLALQHREIPPTPHFKTPNPELRLSESPFFVNRTPLEWRSEGPRRAGVSSFGLGGTNVHAILEEAPRVPPSGPAGPRQLLVLSAQSVSALERKCQELADHLADHPAVPLADVAYTLQVGRKELPHRRMAVCRDVPDAIAVLRTLSPERVFTREQEPVRRPVTFLFPGQGAQFARMGAEAYALAPIYREEVDRCSLLLQPHLGLDLRALLHPAPGAEAQADEQLARTELTQPAMFVVDYAMARQWMAWGVHPEQMIGHSVGEFVAACLAGVFSLEDALAVVAARGRLMAGLPRGAMLAVPLPESEVTPLLGSSLDLAAVNGPAQCVVSGTEEAISALEAELTTRRHICRRLRTSHAFHSRAMDPIVDEFRTVVAGIPLRTPQARYLSNVTGTWITPEQATDPGYWVEHLRRTVRFGDCLQQVLGAPEAVLLEVGPGRTLRTMVRWHPDKLPAQVMLASLPHPQERKGDLEYLLGTIGQLWLAGVSVDWDVLHAGERRHRVPLPTYPFERRRYWVDRPSSGRSLGKRPDLADWFYAPTWTAASTEAQSPAGAQGSWLAFEDEQGLAARVGDVLQDQGQQVVRVRPGPSFARTGERHFTLDPSRPDDYAALTAELRRTGRLPGRVLHGWSLGHPSSMEEALQNGFHSLLHLVRSVGAQPDALDLVVLTSGVFAPLGTESLHPGKATVLGACQVVPREYPNVRCRLWDVDVIAADDPRAPQVSARLVRDLLRDEPALVAAYHGQRRWVRDFHPLRLPPEASPLREGGVYLITGGLGGLGLEVAARLARTHRAKLVLVGRSAVPERQTARVVRRLREMESAGAEVLTVAADVADEAQMRAVIERATARFGRIDGVLHAAGVPGGGWIATRSAEAAAAVLAPKVQGTLVLDAVLKDRPLDFFVVFSSLSTVVGRLGQADYTAANAFLDTFAAERQARTGQLTTSIGWGAWEQVGMAASPRAADDTAGERLEHPLLERRLSSHEGHEVYATGFHVDKHWVLDEHRILGNPVIPGVAYFEMVRAALAARAGGKIVELQDVFFLLPLRVRDGEVREVQLTLEPAPEGAIRFKITAWEPDRSTQEYTVGHVVLREAEPLHQHDLAAIRRRCDQQELLLAAEEREEDLGPRWHSVQRVNLGHNEVLLYLELPAAFLRDFDHMKFHPALLDRAAGIAKNFLAKDGHYLPLTYKRVQIKAPLQRKIYSWARFREEDDPSRETITFDIVLMDETGRGLVEIEGFSQKRVNDPGAEIRSLAGGARAPEEAADPDRGEIQPEEGVEALLRILAARVSPQVVVSVRDLHAAIEQTDQVVRDRLLDATAPAARGARPLHPRPEIGTPYVEPRNEMEQRVAEAWKEVLGIDRVGIHDSFFELGGDSLVATRVIFRLERELGVRIPPVSIFEGATIAKLVEIFAAKPEEGEAYQDQQARGELRRARSRRRAHADTQPQVPETDED